MSESSSDQSAVVAADSTRTFTPRPLIEDIMRTKYCIPGSIFLVEGIDTSVPVRKRYRAARLLLGDGELCIQALVRKEMHPFIDSGQVYVGCYLRLNQFELRFLARENGPDGQATGTSDMVFLVVQDMVTVGWNTAFLNMASTVAQDSELAAPTATGDARSEASKIHIQEGPKPEAITGHVQSKPSKVDEDSDPDDGFEVMNIPERKTIDRRKEGLRIHQRSIVGRGNANSSSANLPWTTVDLAKPLKLTPLKSIPHLPYKQNWKVNVLAVVASLSGIEAAYLPPYKQRIVGLADPSTSNLVLLTVLLNAEEFTPAVGSVVLLIGVKNHISGYLKKYGNERLKDDSKWWFENPVELEWCDVAGLKEWWTTKGFKCEESRKG